MLNKTLLFSTLQMVTAMASAALPLAAVAAPPGGGSSPPPVVDLAYMDNRGSALRALQVGAAGTASGDVALWKLSGLYFQSLSWDPDGNWLAWAQTIDRKGTRAIVTGKPGSAPTAALTFPSGNITRRNGIDTIAWGRGCNGQSVIVFLGDDLYAVFDGLYVFDPSPGGAGARLLYPIKHGPEGSPDRGHGIAFSPQGQHLAFVEQDNMGFNRVVALPLTCEAGDPLPKAAASSAQVLFAVESVLGIDGGRAWSLGLDWSADGHRLVGSVAPLLEWRPGYRSWGVGRIAVGELAYSLAGGVEQVSAAESAMHVVTSGPAPGQADYSDELPSWGPSVAAVACDRLAFSRSGLLTLLDVPRAGFTVLDCQVPVPSTISGKSTAGLDWR